MLQPNRIQHLYQPTIAAIMAEHDIPLLPIDYRDHVVTADATFQEVAQHTELHIGGRTDTHAHYRYRRYQQVLNLAPHGQRRLAHIDIGCGAGLFSWVLLDWAADRGLAHANVELYGLDHSASMIALAAEVRVRLMPQIPTYPALHYEDDANLIINAFTDNHRAGTDYIITFGHVLAQAHAPANIQTFTRVISNIVALPNDLDSFPLIAVDAQHWSAEFMAGWDALLAHLEQAGIGHEPVIMPTTAINDNSRAKYARLRPAG